MNFAIACFAVVIVGSRANPLLFPQGAETAQVANDFGQGQQQAQLQQQQQQGQLAFDPSSYALDPTVAQFQQNQRLSGNSFFSAGQQGVYPGQQAGVQQQQQPGEQQWSPTAGDMADLSQVLMQNVVAQQVSQLQQGQPDPLATSPYHTLLKNLAGTAPIFPPVAPGVAADSRFPGQILAQGPAGELVEKLDPPGPPHPPLNVENANYLTAVASIPQRIGANIVSPNLPAAFPHQTFMPSIGYMNRGQQAPPSFNPWPANLQGGAQQSQIQQQNFAAQLRNSPSSFNQAQRHPSGQNVFGSNPQKLPQNKFAQRSSVADESSSMSRESTAEQQSKLNKTENELQEENLKIFLTKQIQEYKIVSYGVSSCQVCEDTLKILRTYKVPVQSFQLDATVMGNEILEIMQKQTGSKDIPQVFICGHFVGGFRKVQELHKSDDLKNLIKRCNP